MSEKIPATTRIATLFGIGRAPFLPGTVGALAALPIGWWLAILGGWRTLLIGTAALALISIWACGAHAKRTGSSDPAECVADEAVGQWLALVPVAFTGRLFHLTALASAFLLFRFFDILKPWPISALERWPGGLGIVADDVLAGALAGALVGAAAALNLV